MNTAPQASSKVSAAHLRRGAYLYVRQSTIKQVLTNTESTLRQYDLRGRAIAFGWSSEQITVIDIDQGHSGASAADREGFQRLVADVGMGKAGIVLGLECSRLARDNSLFRYRNKAFCSAYGFMPRRDEEFLPGW
jgi:DNA invertase Pin-like site-specific DNA recombinase